MPNAHISHDIDFYSWIQEQAELLRQGRLHEADVQYIAEELESMGASERRELINRLAVLLAHLLKWHYEPQRQSRSWRLTIKTQRFDARVVLQHNPGLKRVWPECLELAYKRAQIQAANETYLDESTFPVDCPWSFTQIFDDEFLP